MFRRTCYLILLVALCVPVHAQEIEMPSPNLRQVVRSVLNLPDGHPITPEAMLELRELRAKQNPINDLTGLEYATNLELLTLSSCNISDVRPLAGLTRLQLLNLGANPLVDISPLAGLTGLRTLHLHECNIVDIRPLANLTKLVTLGLPHNNISDFSPLSNLTKLEDLDIRFNPATNYDVLAQLPNGEIRYDEVCVEPPFDIRDRLMGRTFPSVFNAWGKILNRGYVSRDENFAEHDLMWGDVSFELKPKITSEGTWMVGDLDRARNHRAGFAAMNPNMLFLLEIRLVTFPTWWFPESWPHWLRDSQGRWLEGSGRAKVDFAHPEVQDYIVQRALAVERCGLYDGIFIDHGSETYNPLEGYRSFEESLAAKESILQAIRAQARPDFLIITNSGKSTLPHTGKYINGLFMETGVPIALLDHELHPRRMDEALNKIRNTLNWGSENLRPPHVICLEGGAFRKYKPDHPINLQYMRLFTTLGLTHSDGYVLFTDGFPGHQHYWYDFWDADLGMPVGEKGQRYQETDGLYIREFTNGWAVYNHSGKAQDIAVPQKVWAVTSELLNTEHTLSDLDGEIYLKEIPPTDSTDIDGSDIYISDSIHAVPGALLLLDASYNPGSAERWVNLGTAGGGLQAADKLPMVEEGEIEIPAIGFSSRRRYFTATAPRETFGGPVNKNPTLFLGDWTLEFLCKRNGNLFIEEHHFAGFQYHPRESLQGIRLRMGRDGRELELSINADGSYQPRRDLNIFLEESVWTWVTIVSKNGESIIAYQDGVEVSRHPGAHFDDRRALHDISIGANSYEERHRNFNGSFAIVRVYDRALSPDEVLKNISGSAIPDANPADVNDDGAVNILDLVVVAQGFGTDKPEGDVNGDGIVNVFDLVQVAEAIGAGGAAPSAYSLDPSIISAADVERWLAGAQGLGIGDANFQRGIRFLEGLLAALRPKETALLPNYPNPFNPETWIPYHLAREAEVAITIYDTKGTLVRRLALGNQPAGHYAERGKAAYWDGRNNSGEAVASGIYIYQFRAGNYAASRRMVIVK